jgi:hypothetical protein
MINKSKTISIIACLGFTVLIFEIVQATNHIWTSLRNTKKFDYTRYLDNEELAWTGPKKGEKIDLRNLHNKEGQELPDAGYICKTRIRLSALVEASPRQIWSVGMERGRVHSPHQPVGDKFRQSVKFKRRQDNVGLNLPPATG